MFNWLSTFFPRRTGLRPAPHIEALAVHNSTIWPDLAETASETLVYQQSPWVYIVVNRIAEAAALVPLHVLRVQGEQHTEVERHPLEVLFDAPNPYMSRFELFEQTVGMLELCGDAYWFLAGDSSGQPSEIWPLRPDRISIVPDPDSYIKGYVYEIDGRRIPLLPAEVVHFKRWHPANDYYGLSALEAGKLAVTSDRAMAEWNRNTFSKDNGVPAGVVTIKNQVSDADYERIKREWRQTYGGPQRHTAFLRGDTVSWQNIGLNHNELDFLKGREAHRDEILNIFGIPVGLVSENATEANATVAERQFIERTLWPKLVRIAQKITQEMLPFWPGMHVAEFEDIRPTDTQARLDEIKTAYPILSINEIRQRYYRLSPVEWGSLPVGSNVSVGARHVLPLQNTDSAATSPVVAAATPPGNGGNKTLTRQNDENGGNADDHVALSADSLGMRALHSELTQWERFALKRLGKPNTRSFEVRSLPGEVAFEISAGLLAAESDDDVKAVFADARTALEDGVTA